MYLSVTSGKRLALRIRLVRLGYEAGLELAGAGPGLQVELGMSSKIILTITIAPTKITMRKFLPPMLVDVCEMSDSNHSFSQKIMQK